MIHETRFVLLLGVIVFAIGILFAIIDSENNVAWLCMSLMSSPLIVVSSYAVWSEEAGIKKKYPLTEGKMKSGNGHVKNQKG